MTQDVSQKIAAAYATHQSGAGALAEQQYRAILADHPDQIDTLYLLSALLLPARPDEALRLAQSSLASSSGAGGMGVGEAVLLDHCAECLRATGATPETELARLESAMRIDPARTGRLFRIGDAQVRCGQWHAATESFERYLAAFPDDINARTNLGGLQLHVGRYEEAATNLERVLKNRPDHLQALINLGAVRVRQQRFGEAAGCFENVLAMDPANPAARFGLNEIHLKAVPRWHFPMMNDRGRNALYDRAIRRAVQARATGGHSPLVLDIGAGSGLLSMMAARAGAGAVVACEVVAPIAAKARQIVAANGFAERVAIHTANSTELRIGDQLPRKADILVTEIFDPGLLGEDALPTLAHARRHLLAEGGAVIPAAARVWMMPIESPGVFEDYAVRNDNACGFDLRSFNEFATARYDALRLAAHPFEALSKPIPVLDFDFSADVPDRSLTLEFLPVRSGVVHAWVFWFTLILDDENRFDAGPYNPATHWRQAVQIAHETPLLEAGVTAQVRVEQTQNNIRFALVDPQSREKPHSWPC